MSAASTHPLPPFEPPRWLRGPHAQTLAAWFLPGGRALAPSTRRVVALPDGDALALHDDAPPGWRPGARAALLVHGLGGDATSGYVERLTARLLARGVRVFRADLRGAGAGMPLARLPYHSGRSDDLGAALSEIARLSPGSPLSIAGFSLGGHLVLRLLGERAASLPASLDRAVAVSPPTDLAASVARLRRGLGPLYDRWIVRELVAQARAHRRARPDAPEPRFPRLLGRIRDFDEAFTAPIGGFASVDDYYRLCSSAPLLPSIRVPTLVLSSRDDPMVDPAALEAASASASLRLLLTERGGHLGFLSRSGDGERRWMDARVIEALVPREYAASP